ncbi:KGG domain-containing protein [Pseudomonas fulva]|uniref:general stress protein n=1 Tax=Pseudomonas fulva TaxID=47880 RepID=UPI002DBED285|nr:KGG domain-containing protein [Pseudomonas fulva]MEC4023648.1 KGG domain-containing protein [Pseudomonas fulva]
MASNDDKHANQDGSSNTNPGNFANDPQKAAEAGREGGKNSHGGGRSSDENR